MARGKSCSSYLLLVSHYFEVMCCIRSIAAVRPLYTLVIRCVPFSACIIRKFEDQDLNARPVMSYCSFETLIERLQYCSLSHVAYPSPFLVYLRALHVYEMVWI